MMSSAFMQDCVKKSESASPPEVSLASTPTSRKVKDSLQSIARILCKIIQEM